MKSDPLAKSLERLERVKGIEPSYSAWKSQKRLLPSTLALTFSMPLAYWNDYETSHYQIEENRIHLSRGTPGNGTWVRVGR